MAASRQEVQGFVKKARDAFAAERRTLSYKIAFGHYQTEMMKIRQFCSHAEKIESRTCCGLSGAICVDCHARLDP